LPIAPPSPALQANQEATVQRTTAVALIMAIALIVVTVLLILCGPAQTEGTPSPSPSASASVTPTPVPTVTPASAAAVTWALRWRRAAVRSWTRFNHARWCLGMPHRSFASKRPLRTADSATWTKAAHRWKAMRHLFRVRTRRLVHKMTHPGGSSNGVRWLPLARWVGWPAGTLHRLAGLIMNESSGRQNADNGICCSLTQIHRCWAGTFRRVIGHPYWRGIFNPEWHLRFALYIYRVVQHGSFLPAWVGDPAVS
jgi:hypothetical protein